MKPVIRPEQPLIEGVNFRRLSVEEGKGRYRFMLTEDWTLVYSLNIVEGEVSFRDASHREWVRMTPRTKTIRSGYAWNGNTPKRGFRLFGKDCWLGVPDYPETMAPSGNHDSDFQFSHCEHFPFSWTEVNHHYLLLAQQSNFKLARAFHGALVDFSSPAWKAAAAQPVYSVLL